MSNPHDLKVTTRQFEGRPASALNLPKSTATNISPGTKNVSGSLLALDLESPARNGHTNHRLQPGVYPQYHGHSSLPAEEPDHDHQYP